MAPHPLLGIFLIGIIFSSSMTAGYNQVIEPLSGRTFSLLNLLPFQRISSIQYTALQSRVTAVETNLNTLTTQIAATTEKCPTTSKLLGAQLIGTYCYAVIGATVGNRLSFLAALERCQKHGGSLAEPLANRVANTNLYNALKDKFPGTFAAVESTTSGNGGKFWIGYFSTAAAILSVTTSAGPLSQTIALNTPEISLPAPVDKSGVLLIKPVSPPAAYWELATYDPDTPKNPYICQFTALA